MEQPNWPIFQLAQQKEAFVGQVVVDTLKSLEDTHLISGSYKRILEKTVYKERTRIKKMPWAVDPKNESKKWSNYKSQLTKLYSQSSVAESPKDKEYDILKAIVQDYAREIMGHFNYKTYKFSIRAVPVFLNRILNGISGRLFFGFFQKKKRFRDKIKIQGDIDLIKSLEKKGTLVLVPTHFSNLDSMLIGFAIYLIGLPPFIYGAGLNLFNNKIVSYFISRLGAYKLDRRKKNAIYLETLKTFSRVALQRGVHTLFFPGGTRSRTGALESKLKLGLLNTVIEAQRNNYLNENQQKIYIVPLVVSYHFVLEAPGLIKQHLKTQGKEKLYLEREKFGGFFKTIRFIYKFLSKGSSIVLSYGKPIDVFGYYVNNQGESIDQNGQKLDPQQYFTSSQKITTDKQRESQYTNALSDKIIKEFFSLNIVLSSHLVSFVAFQMIKKQFKDFDLYNMLKLDNEDTAIEYDAFKNTIERVCARIKALEAQNKIKYSKSFEFESDTLIAHGIKNVGVFHPKKVLFIDKKGRVNTQNMNTLYYYHNRLEGYMLDQYV